MTWLFLLYLGLGIVIDFLITIQYRAVSEKRVWLATLMSFAITLIGTLLIQEIVVSKSIGLILSYALGTGIGTFIGMVVKRCKRPKESQDAPR
jgi:hypothetical protein